MTRWYVERGHGPEGPHDEAAVRQWSAAGQLPAHTSICREGDTRWWPIAALAPAVVASARPRKAGLVTALAGCGCLGLLLMGCVAGVWVFADSEVVGPGPSPPAATSSPAGPPRPLAYDEARRLTGCPGAILEHRGARGCRFRLSGGMLRVTPAGALSEIRVGATTGHVEGGDLVVDVGLDARLCGVRFPSAGASSAALTFDDVRIVNNRQEVSEGSIGFAWSEVSNALSERLSAANGGRRLDCGSHGGGGGAVLLADYGLGERYGDPRTVADLAYVVVQTNERRAVDGCRYVTESGRTAHLTRIRPVYALAIRDLRSGAQVAAREFLGEVPSCPARRTFRDRYYLSDEIVGQHPDGDEMRRWVESQLRHRR